MNDEVTIILNNKDVIKIKKNTSIREVIQSNKEMFDNTIIGVKVNNDIVSYDYKITKDVTMTTFNANDINGYKMFQAGLKFVMIVALKELFGKNVDVIFDHSIARGIHATIINKDEFNVITLYVFHRLQFSEIAKIYDKSVSAVNNIYYRGITKIKKSFEREIEYERASEKLL